MKTDLNQHLNTARLARSVVASIIAGVLFTASALTSRDEEKPASLTPAQAAASPTEESITDDRLSSSSPEPALFRLDATEHHD